MTNTDENKIRFYTKVLIQNVYEECLDSGLDICPPNDEMGEMVVEHPNKDNVSLHIHPMYESEDWVITKFQNDEFTYITTIPSKHTGHMECDVPMIVPTLIKEIRKFLQ